MVVLQAPGTQMQVGNPDGSEMVVRHEALLRVAAVTGPRHVLNDRELSPSAFQFRVRIVLAFPPR
jgi:hypothetical protein